MRVGVAGPVSMDLLGFPSGRPADLPAGYPAPVISFLVNGLLRRGHEVVVFTTSPDLSAPRVWTDPPLTVCVGRRWRGRSALRLFRREREDLVQLMSATPVDVMHANWTYEFAWAALDSGTPTLVTVHDVPWEVIRYKPDAYRVLRMSMSLRTFGRASVLTAVSESVAERLPRTVRAKTVVVNDFADESLFGPVCTRGERAPVVLTVSNGAGRLKNVVSGLRGFALFRKRCPTFEYRLVGQDMEPGGPAKIQAARLGLESGVTFVGPIPYEDAIAEMRRSMVVLHCSLEESFGMSVLEALHTGTPVIGGGGSGNIPWLLDHGKAGVLCDVHSPEEIASALEQLTRDEEEWRRLSDAGVERAKGYSADQALDLLEDLYSTVSAPSVDRRVHLGSGGSL